MSIVISFQYQFLKILNYFRLTMELKRHLSFLYIYHWYLMQHCKDVSYFYVQYSWIFFNVGKSCVKSYVNQRCSHLKFRIFIILEFECCMSITKSSMPVQIHNHNSCVYDDWEFCICFLTSKGWVLNMNWLNSASW